MSLVTIASRRRSGRRLLVLAVAAALLISMIIVGVWGYLSNPVTEAADSSAAGIGIIEGAHLDIASGRVQQNAH